MNKIRYCKKCLANSLRPRLEFDKNGICSACNWTAEKKTVVNWNLRWKQLEQLCEKYRSNKNFDCIVPVSGGKDGSYVAYQLKEKFGMHPLCVTINPDMRMKVGKKNLDNFANHGYDLIAVTPNIHISKKLNKQGFIDQGRPMNGWMMAVQATVLKLAVLYQIPFIMFGEDGETEYGGSVALKNSPFYSIDDTIRLYLSGNNSEILLKNMNPSDIYWYTFPSENEIKNLDIKVAHWSYFENWDSDEHETLAIEKFGMLGNEERSVGTYTKYSQNDTYLYVLHTYMMFLKFGFGRCTQDVCIDIRSGKLSRKEGINLILKYDDEYPEKYINNYLDYFEMTKEEFSATLDKHANKEILEKRNGRWKMIDQSYQ